MNNEIRFACSHCDQKMMVDAHAAGRTVDCPNCGTGLTVPLHDELPKLANSVSRPRDNTLSSSPPGAPRTGGGGSANSISPDASASAMRQDLIAASVQTTRLESELTEVRQQLKKVRSDLSRTIAEKNEAITIAHQYEEGLREAEEALREAHEGAAGVSRQLDHTQRDLLERDGELEYARHQLADTQAERTGAMREIQALEDRIAGFERDLAFARAELAAAEKVSARLAVAEEEISQFRVQIVGMEAAADTLQMQIADLTAERDSLLRSVSESGLGQELITTRDQLGAVTKERDHFGRQARQFAKDLEVAEAARTERDDTIKMLRQNFEAARKAATSVSEDKVRQDNQVLRGIIARQNSELEQRHAQVARFKRARLGVQLAYAGFVFALVIIAVWAFKTVPGLKLGEFLKF